MTNNLKSDTNWKMVSQEQSEQDQYSFIKYSVDKNTLKNVWSRDHQPWLGHTNPCSNLLWIIVSRCDIEHFIEPFDFCSMVWFRLDCFLVFLYNIIPNATLVKEKLYVDKVKFEFPSFWQLK